MIQYEHEIINDDDRLQLSFRPIYSADSYIPLHWHSHLEILFILKGYMTVFINDRKYILKKGDMVVIGSRDLHSTRTISKVNYILLQIPYDYLTRSLSHVSLIQFQTYFPAAESNPNEKQLCDCLFQLLKTYEKQEDGYQLYFSSVVYQFLFLLYRNYSRRITREDLEKENRNFEKMEEIIQYVKINYRREITLKEASQLLSVSPEYFCRLFKKHTGQTFLEYLNTIRMGHFYHDLTLTDYSINELLERNGITNYKVFMRMFKAAYKTTPGKLRKSLSLSPEKDL